MARYARDNRPHVKPLQRIQLPEENLTLRLVAAGLFLLIGAGALVYSFLQLFTPDTGWQTIQAGSTDGATCGEDFTLVYELGSGEQPIAAENRELTRIYGQACRTAYQLFHTVERFEGVTNLREISVRPNETLTVDPALYAAFGAVRAAGDRTVYLGPICARYGDLFNCQDDSQIGDFDPWTSEAVAEEYAAVAAYAANPGHIDVELLGENQIRLRVSEEYLAWAEREGIDRLLDFGWMTNAFIADYLADTLAQAGYTHGVLSSYDGFIRCLDGRDTPYTLGLCGWLEDRLIEAASMEYRGPMSVVSLHGFPVTQGDWQRFYQLKDGQLRTPYLDPADGRCRSAADCLVCWSADGSCARLVLEMAPVFVADEFEPAPLERLAGEGLYSLWCRDRVFRSTDPDLALDNLYQNGGVRYSLEPVA